MTAATSAPRTSVQQRCWWALSFNAFTDAAGRHLVLWKLDVNLGQIMLHLIKSIIDFPEIISPEEQDKFAFTFSINKSEFLH